MQMCTVIEIFLIEKENNYFILFIFYNKIKLALYIFLIILWIDKILTFL